MKEEREEGGKEGVEAVSGMGFFAARRKLPT